MNGRERLAATLEHRQPDRVCVDFGATWVTGMHASIVDKLRKAVLGDGDWRVKICEPYQMLGEIDDELREALGIDVIGVLTRKSLFGTDATGLEAVYAVRRHRGARAAQFQHHGRPGHRRSARLSRGRHVRPRRPGGCPRAATSSTRSSARSRSTRRGSIRPTTARSSPCWATRTSRYYRRTRQWFDQRGAVRREHRHRPGTAFGDIALVPAPFLERPRGIRDIAEWYMSTATRRDYVHAVFERQCEIAQQNLQALIDLFGDAVQVAVITGTDFGTQTGLFMSVDAYRDLFKPYHKRINDLIHARSSLEDVHPLLRQRLGSDAGLHRSRLRHPQSGAVLGGEDGPAAAEGASSAATWCSGAAGSTRRRRMAFGTPDEVYREVRERIEIFNDGGGFVFNAIHNIQGNMPIENVLAMFRAMRDSGLNPQ